MRVLNFVSTEHHSQLPSQRKNCTVRVGDKTEKYSKGDIVWLTVGKRFTPRHKLCAAVIDAVSVKQLKDLTADDLRGEAAKINTVADMLAFLEAIYEKPLTPETQVTVVYFSEVTE